MFPFGPNVPPVAGQPPFQDPPGGINPDPLALLQLSFQNLCQQVLTITQQPKLTYTENGRTFAWTEYLSMLIERIEQMSKIPGVAPTIEGPFQIVQRLAFRCGSGWGWRGC